MLPFMPLNYSSTKPSCESALAQPGKKIRIPQRTADVDCPASSQQSVLLCDGDRRSYGSVFEKPNRHLSGQPNAAVRCGKRRNISLMHRVAASEEHRIRHSGAIKMRALRLGIFSGIDIGFNDVTVIVHVIAKHRRDVAC